ncbi:MAG: response regulator [Oligoflexia bacterium]|nr:response regulator [Oligoflexia bacterium]
MTCDSLSLLDSTTSVLIVDDNPQYSQLLKKLLNAAFSYSDITCAQDLESAFALVSAAEKKFRLIFVDYRFPGQDRGTDLLRRLQQGGYLDSATAFLITSEPTPENAKLAASYGAYGVVAKPFDREELRRQIEGADRYQRVKRESF